MTIPELQEIIAINIDAAEAGSLQAQGQVIEAQAELERLEALERAEFGATREELTDFSMMNDEDREFEGQSHDQWEDQDFF